MYRKCDPCLHQDMLDLARASPDLLRYLLRHWVLANFDGAPWRVPASANRLNYVVSCLRGLRHKTSVEPRGAADFADAIYEIAGIVMGQAGRAAADRQEAKLKSAPGVIRQRSTFFFRKKILSK